VLGNGRLLAFVAAAALAVVSFMVGGDPAAAGTGIIGGKK
jgi:hypothetical protein